MFKGLDMTPGVLLKLSPCCLVLAMVGRKIYIRSVVRRIFHGDFGSRIEPTEIRVLLEQINTDSKEVKLSAKEAIRFVFCDQSFPLIHGSASFITLTYRNGLFNAQSQDVLFVVSSNEDAHLLAKQKDIFRKNFSGTSHTVFFVEPREVLNKVLRGLRGVSRQDKSVNGGNEVNTE